MASRPWTGSHLSLQLYVALLFLCYALFVKASVFESESALAPNGPPSAALAETPTTSSQSDQPTFERYYECPPTVSPELEVFMPTHAPTFELPTGGQSPTSSSSPGSPAYSPSLEVADDGTRDDGDDGEGVIQPVEICSASPTGAFGTFQGGGDAEELRYFYQVETTPSISSADAVNSNILPGVERAVSDTLLPTLFPNQCVASTGKMRTLQGRRLEVEGIAGFPADVVMEGENCEGSPSDGNNCFVCDGKATLYTSLSGEELDMTLKAARAAIQEAMDSGAYNDLDGDIVNVTYRDDPALLQRVSNGEGESQGNGEDGSSRFPAYAWAAIAASGTLILVVGAVTTKRCRRAAADSTEESQNEYTASVEEGQAECGEPRLCLNID